MVKAELEMKVTPNMDERIALSNYPLRRELMVEINPMRTSVFL
jgi:hypothetical protein